MESCGEGYACCAANGAGSGMIWQDALNCPADALALEDCPGWTWGDHTCGHQEDVSVTCIDGE